MSENRWVCHISGQGEKWKLQKFQDPEWPSWVAPHTVNGGGLLYLPKSEYRLCDPPEVWRDVTDGVVEKETQNVCWWYWMHGEEEAVACHISKGYRLRKVHLWTQNDEQQWAFIVEQKVSV